MDDYIYILLAVAWIAFTIYSQKQKKNKQQQKAKPQQQTQKDVKSYFEEILLGNVSSPDPIPTEPVIHEEIYESVSGYKTSGNIRPEYEFLEEGSQLSEEYFDKNSAIEKPEIQIEEKYEIQTEEEYENIEYLDFDIRKAVIYSEILKCPYT